MRGNLNNEVLIALGAVGIVICGLLFAILLSSTVGDNNPRPTNRPPVGVTANTQSNTDESPEVTETEAEESEVTATAIEEETEEATVTFTETPEEVSIEPSATDTETPSDTPSPSATPTPTQTETSVPTDTRIPRDDMNSAEGVERLTPTPQPTETSTPEPTDIPEEPTDKPTQAVATDTDEPEPTRVNPTPTPTSEAINGVNIGTGIIPTLPASPTVVPLDNPTRTPASCDLPSGWTTYTVASGDTLFAIALATNTTVDELRFANCIDDIDNITAGDAVFVPRAPVRPVSTVAPAGVRDGLTTIGCTSPLTQITSPILGQRVSGTFTVFGTATRADFEYYKIEIRPDNATIYNFYSDSREQVINGELGHINAELFGDGLHWIRLSVVDRQAMIQPDAICEIPVIFG